MSWLNRSGKNVSISEMFLDTSGCSPRSASYRDVGQCVFKLSVISSRGLRKLLLAPDIG